MIRAIIQSIYFVNSPKNLIIVLAGKDYSRIKESRVPCRISRADP
jgi:hypothetical protein